MTCTGSAECTDQGGNCGGACNDPGTLASLSPSQSPSPPGDDNGILVLIIVACSIGGVMILLMVVVVVLVRKNKGAQAVVIAPLPVKKYKVFLSHYKREAASEARILCDALDNAYGKGSAFLDSDCLHDLRKLLDEHLVHSEVVIVLQTKGVFTRPWCLMELATAIDHNIPIVAVNVQNCFLYDFADSANFLKHLDLKLDLTNPGARADVEKHGFDLTKIAYQLSNVIPNIISTAFNPAASRNVLNATVMDIQDAIADAEVISCKESLAEWLRNRDCSNGGSTSKAMPLTEA